MTYPFARFLRQVTPMLLDDPDPATGLLLAIGNYIVDSNQIWREKPVALIASGIGLGIELARVDQARWNAVSAGHSGEASVAFDRPMEVTERETQEDIDFIRQLLDVYERRMSAEAKR